MVLVVTICMFDINSSSYLVVGILLSVVVLLLSHGIRGQGGILVPGVGTVRVVVDLFVVGRLEVVVVVGRFEAVVAVYCWVGIVGMAGCCQNQVCCQVDRDFVHYCLDRARLPHQAGGSGVVLTGPYYDYQAGCNIHLLA